MDSIPFSLCVTLLSREHKISVPWKDGRADGLGPSIHSGPLSLAQPPDVVRPPKSNRLNIFNPDCRLARPRSRSPRARSHLDEWFQKFQRRNCSNCFFCSALSAADGRDKLNTFFGPATLILFDRPRRRWFPLGGPECTFLRCLGHERARRRKN